MPKDHDVYLDDIINSIEKIERYTKGIVYEKFEKNEIVIDAVVRNLEIVGEAVKNLPPSLRQKYPEIEWKKIAGLRDILIHEYFGIDAKILWDVVSNKLPELKKFVKKIKAEMK